MFSLYEFTAVVGGRKFIEGWEILHRLKIGYICLTDMINNILTFIILIYILK